jgi:hypothetical protein
MTMYFTTNPLKGKIKAKLTKEVVYIKDLEYS